MQKLFKIKLKEIENSMQQYIKSIFIYTYVNRNVEVYKAFLNFSAIDVRKAYAYTKRKFQIRTCCQNNILKKQIVYIHK